MGSTVRNRLDAAGDSIDFSRIDPGVRADALGKSQLLVIDVYRHDLSI